MIKDGHFYYINRPTVTCNCGSVFDMTIETEKELLTEVTEVVVHGHCQDCHSNINFMWPVQKHAIVSQYNCNEVDRPRDQIS